MTYRQALAYKGFRGPIQWYGGKGNMVARMVSLLPDSWDAYVEPFVGGGALFFRLPPVGFEVINDLDDRVIDLYRVLRDPVTFVEFNRLAQFTLHSFRIFRECRESWQWLPTKVERAWAWWAVQVQSFSACWGHSWSASTGLSLAKNVGQATSGSSRIAASKSRLVAVHRRLASVAIECRDAREVIAEYGRPGALVYCDPPYVHSTRRGTVYMYEMTDADHEELVDLLLASPARVMVSGYDHPVYRRLDEAGWHRAEFVTSCHATGRTVATGVVGSGSATRDQRRVEVVWRNYRRVEEEELPCLFERGQL